MNKCFENMAKMRLKWAKIINKWLFLYTFWGNFAYMGDNGGFLDTKWG